MATYVNRHLVPLHRGITMHETINECADEGGSSGSDDDCDDGDSDDQEYEWNIQQAIWANALHAIDPNKYKKTAIPAPAQSISRERQLKKSDTKSVIRTESKI